MRILLVDDERLARVRLRQLLEDLGSHEVIGEAGNGEEALALAARENPDVVLLDIRMPGLSGIETAHHLNSTARPPAVVFTTAYDEYAIEAFDARAIGYLLKPVRSGRLRGALEHAARLTRGQLTDLAQARGLSSKRRHVAARAKGRLKLIPVADILYFRAEHKYVCVRHARGQDLIDESLKSLEQAFASNFVRIHRNALVRVDAIDRLETRPDGQVCIVLRTDAENGDNALTDDLIVSRRHRASVRRRVKGR